MSTVTRRQILVVVPRLKVGGTERHLLQVLPRIDKHSHDVTVFTTRGAGSLDRDLRAAGVAVVNTPQLLPGRLNAFVAFLHLCVYLARHRPDLVHCFLPEAYIAGAPASLVVAGAKRVMSRRSLNDYQAKRPLARPIEIWLHKRMDALIGNSRAVVDQLREEGAADDRLGLIYNGTDTAAFAAVDRDQVRRRLGLASDTLVLVIVATLYPYKGHEDLLEALALAEDALPERWTLFVAGRDEGVERRLRAKAQRLGLDRHIVWLGETAAVAELLCASDIGILCSHEEGFPNAALECMAAGLPMIVTPVGGSAEAVLDGETGLFVPPRDPQALSRAITDLASDPERRRALGTAGRVRVERLFSIEACVAAYERLYDALLADRVESVGSLFPSVTIDARDDGTRVAQ